jgi:glycosidase
VNRLLYGTLVVVLLGAAGCVPAASPSLEPTAVAADGGAIDWRRQVIYLALVDRFANGSTKNDNLGLPGCFDARDPQKWHGGDFVGMRGRLSYLTDLGVSALWVTPAYRQSPGPTGRCGYHGYWADFADPDDGAVEPRLGTPDELSALADALHGAGMGFILDMVVNHAGDGARIVGQQPDWFHDPARCGRLGDRDLYCPYRAGIHDFAQEKAEVASYLSQQSAGWVRRFAVDGIRMDTARYVLPSYFHDSWVPAVRAERPLFLVAEVFSETVGDLKPYLDAGFDSTFNFPLRGALVSAVGHEQSLDAVASVLAEEQRQLGADRARALVNFIDNHDTPRFTNEPGFGVANDEIRLRQHLALAIAFAAPGIPQIYAGDELGLYGGNDPDNRRDMPAWAWTAAGRAASQPPDAMPDAQRTYSFVQRLIALRKGHAALADGDYRELWRPNGWTTRNVLAFLRSDASEQLVLVANGGPAPATVTIPLQGRIANGVTLDDLYAAGAPASVTTAAGALRLTLPAKSAALYRPR